MNRTTLITACVTAAICVALLLMQRGRNSALEKQLTSDTASVEQLERRAASPGPVSALGNPGAPLPGSVEAAVIEARENSTPQERIDRAVARIEALVADIGDVDQSPAELFKVLPDLLRMVQELDLGEMIAVAQAIDAPLSMGDTDGKGAMKMILLMLAAEQDPQRILEIPDIMENRELRGMVLSSLARKDPKAAREWMASSDMPARERKQMEQMMMFQVLREDVASGLEMIRESDNAEEAMQMLSMMGEFGVSKDTVPQFIAALNDPANEELRPALLKMVVGSTLAAGDVAAARAQVEELGMSDTETAAMLSDSIQPLLRSDPDAAFEWLAEVQTEEQFAESLPNEIRSWARDDYNAAGEWLGGMEPSPVRDNAVKTYAKLVAQIDPKAATIWASQISDEEMRLSSVRTAAEKWQADDPAAAGEWLEEQGIELPARPEPEIAPNAIDALVNPGG